MNLSWSNRVIKYVLFIFNLLFVISGIIMIAVGVSVKSYYTQYNFFLNDSYISLPNLLIATGSLIFFISFFGCCGAVRENWFMIFIFSCLLTLIFILEFSAGIAGYVLRDRTSNYLTNALQKTMKDYQFNVDPSKIKPVTEMWDTIQYTFHCCGANKPEDWEDYVNKHVTSGEPSSITTVSSSSATSSAATTTTTTTPTTTPTPSETTAAISSSTSEVLTSKPRKKRAVTWSLLDVQTNDLPATCCKSVSGATGITKCNLNDTTTATYYKTGCVTGFGNYLKDHAVTLGGVGIAIAFIQLFGIIFACHLTKQLKNGFYST